MLCATKKPARGGLHTRQHRPLLGGSCSGMYLSIEHRYVVTTGLEPVTFAMSMQRSNQLS